VLIVIGNCIIVYMLKRRGMNKSRKLAELLFQHAKVENISNIPLETRFPTLHWNVESTTIIWAREWVSNLLHRTTEYADIVTVNSKVIGEIKDNHKVEGVFEHISEISPQVEDIIEKSKQQILDALEQCMKAYVN